jgi:hypothetical protein
MHRIWENHQEYLANNLVLADGTPIRIIETGTKNDHRGGPDFLNATVIVDGLTVIGDVELHRSLELWDAHGHQHDARYSSVMLHVVLHSTDPTVSSELEAPTLPTLALSQNLRLNEREIWRRLFEEVYERSPELPCFPMNLLVPVKFKRRVVERFGDARLDDLASRFAFKQGSEAFVVSLYEHTFDALGYSENRKPFRELAGILSLEVLKKALEVAHPQVRRITFEALYFGVAGLLPQPQSSFELEVNEHIVELQSRWNWIREELQLFETLAESDWAFFRIRPLNTPYRRLAFAAYLGELFFAPSGNTVERFIAKGLQPALGINEFWESRTSFARRLESPRALLGEERAKAITLNVLLPSRIAMLRDSESLQSSHVQELRAEWGNAHSESSAQYLKIVRQELLESESVRTVRFEQGALKLTRDFCFERRCGDCPIGQRLIEKGWKPQVR